MKIMAALDLSDYADFVLIKAIKTARQQNAKMDIVVVAEEQISEEGGASGEPQSRTDLFQKITKTAQLYHRKALDHGVKAKVRVVSGKSAADEIIRYQQAEELDLIVLGRRSHKSGTGSPMGEVARHVAAYATSTVMIVRCMEERDFKD